MKAVDLFAGAGGFTEGAIRAGHEVLWAANHWRTAVDVHASRHPGIVHSCQDLNQADFTQLPDHELLLASPACQGHSTAGQGARGKWGLDYSHHDAERSTAWAVISAAEAKSPEWIVVENVPAFGNWKLFWVWKAALHELGYHTEDLVLDAADFGVAQNRHRLFVVARRGHDPRMAERFPTPAKRTHHRDEWTPMSEILDLDGGDGWKPVSSKGPSVQKRVARSRVKCGDAFLTQHVTTHTGRHLWQPLPTITCADQLAIVNGDMMRPLSVPEYLAGMGFERDYFDGVELTRKEATRMIGNAVCPPKVQGLLEVLS